MAAKVVMPKLSNTMEEGVILKWLKKEGDQVEWGDVIAEIETDKADIELEVYDTGILRKILVPEGARVPVGVLIAIIAAANEDIAPLLEAEGYKAAAAPEEAPPIVAQPVPAEPLPGQEVRAMASPLAKKMAEERGIPLREIRGTGPGGRVVKRDVEEHLTRREAAPTPPVRPAPVAPVAEAAPLYEEVPLTLMRKTIARRMAESKATIPHFYISAEVRMDRLSELRKNLGEAEPDQKLSINDFVVKAVAKALNKYPQVNATFGEEVFRISKEVNVGIAVAVGGGLVTPVLKNADRKGLGEIDREARELIARARERKLKPEEFTGSTFTITNLGMYDVDDFAAIINPPESAILAVGAVTEKPVVEGDKIVIGKTMVMTMSCDHRVIDGVLAAQFIKEVKRILENPWTLLI